MLETDSGGKSLGISYAAPPRRAALGAFGGTLGGFAVGDIAISGGAVTDRDGKTGDVTTIVIEDLTVHARDAQSPVSGRFRGKVNDTAVALEGDFGPLDQLMRQRWPYPVTVQGEINGKKASVGAQVTVQGNVVGLDERKIGSGSSAMTGKMAVVTGTPRSKLTFKLDAPTFSLADFTFPAQAVAAAKAAAPSKYVFSDAPIDVAALKDFDAREITIGALSLPDSRHLDQVHFAAHAGERRSSMYP